MFLSSYHPEIFRSYYYWQTWCPCKRSRSEVKGQGHRSWPHLAISGLLIPVWIHIWWSNDAQSLMLLRRGSLFFFKVIRQISRSHGSNIDIIEPNWAFPDFTNGFEMMHKAWCCLEDVPYCFSKSSFEFQGHTAKKNRRFWPKVGVSGL